MRSLLSSLLAFAFFVVLLGVIYPLAITGVVHVLSKDQATGSLAKVGDQIIGSRLIGQKFEDGKYFWSRPSAHDYDALNSGGTNYAQTSKELQKLAQERRERLAIAHQSDLKSVPPDLIYASGSGLDPHITLEAALYQVDRVAKARGIQDEPTKKAIINMVNHNYLERKFRLLGHTRVNVLRLNMELDELTKKMANG